MGPLLVVTATRLSDLARKGELTARYFNPGDLFDEVHFLVLADDDVDSRLVQPTVGRARFHIHVAAPPTRLGWRTLGWRPGLVGRWADGVLKGLGDLRPALIRCHGVGLESLVATRAAARFAAPVIVSVHANPAVDWVARMRGLRGRASARLQRALFERSLRAADLVLPVYEPIVPYLRNVRVPRFEVAYNVINPDHLRQKTDYRLHEPLRLLSVGRQIEAKNPEAILKALATIPDAHLDLVGDGPLHDRLVALADALGLSGRVRFVRALPNDELVRQLPEYDLFVVHTDFWELSKSVLEALLTGLPVVLNHRQGDPVPELQGDFVTMVSNTPEAYGAAMRELLANTSKRRNLGTRAFEHSQARWSPARTEARFVEIYRRFLGVNGS